MWACRAKVKTQSVTTTNARIKAVPAANWLRKHIPHLLLQAIGSKQRKVEPHADPRQLKRRDCV